MSDTPLLPSSFPETPRGPLRASARPGHQAGRSSGFRNDPFTPRPGLASRPKDLSPLKLKPIKRNVDLSDSGDPPLIPFDVVDAPSQRLYVVAFYVLLNAWRIVPIPIGAWLSALLKVAYDRELAISGRSVKPYDILHNSSLILGRQTIQILPEGSAVLNPARTSFCLGPNQQSVSIPIRINQTTPILLELLRYDLETGQNETIVIGAKRAKQLKRQADKGHAKTDTNTPRDLLLPVKKTGVYQLRRVVDDSKLEVRRRPLDTLVVACPKARFLASPFDRCKGDLSNLTLEVEGTPPLKIKYSRRYNNIDYGMSIQSIQPEKLRSPLTAPSELRSMVNPAEPNFEWALSRRIELPLNESLNSAGDWTYAVEEVHDACGNVANYSLVHEESYRTPSRGSLQARQFNVHERPRISLDDCSAQSYIEAPKGEAVDLPVRFHSLEAVSNDAPYTVTYTFTNESSPDFSSNLEMQEATLKSTSQRPRIRNPGWYSLNSVSSKFCLGEVFEPSSCYLHNPPEPSLSIRSEKLYDKCANSSVGLHVDLALLGTPPFKIRYNVETARGTKARVLNINSLRDQLDLTPSEAGHYRYEFVDLTDSIYPPRSLKGKVPILEQDVKPPASAHFVGSILTRSACYGEPVAVDVQFIGEAPWTLEYEIVHKGKRVKRELDSEIDFALLTTNELRDGGEYVISLTSVRDKTNCKRPLKQEMSVDVRPRRPRAAFGEIDRKRSIWALEDRPVELPVRLEGFPPFVVKFRNLYDNSGIIMEKVFWNENSVVQMSERGLYEIVAINDGTCPGSIDDRANHFEVKWIPRPRIAAIDGKEVHVAEPFVKEEVCEGDEDALELKFEGHPPYSLRYEEQRKPQQGPVSSKVKSIGAALGSTSIHMDTSKAGKYSYNFFELSDNLYGYNNERQQSSLVVQQKVNSKPTARFESPNQVYGLCKEESDAEELIPIILEGVPPFSLEVGVKHHSNVKPEVISIPNINSNHYMLPLPRRYLHLGQHVRVRM
ncbi:hypothetical protein KEM55_007274 [Ascosphaera atra]|nr:hypothetical protein KEM55_007274 [Ascosphaera atra]